MVQRTGLKRLSHVGIGTSLILEWCPVQRKKAGAVTKIGVFCMWGFIAGLVVGVLLVCGVLYYIFKDFELYH